MKRLSFIVTISIILCSITNVTFAPFVEQDPSETRAGLKEKIAEQQNKINRLKAEIDKQQKEINMLQKQVAVLTKLCKDANIPMLALEYLKQKTVYHSDIKGLNLPLNVGQIGYNLGNLGDDVKIKQIIDEKNMLVTLTHYAPRNYYIQNGRRVYTTDGPHISSEKIVWIKGINTAGLVDDTQLKIENVALKVTGTKSYEDAEGATTTVFLLEPVEVVD